MWESYTLLLPTSCGATRYTRRNTHNQDDHTESKCPCIMSSEERVSKEAESVGNKSGNE